MTEHALPEIPVSVAGPDISFRVLILDIDLSQKPELRPALDQLIAVDGWRLSFHAVDLATNESLIVQFRGGA